MSINESERTHVLPIAEERAVFETREVPGEKVTVRVVSDTADHVLREVLESERLVVERIQCNKPVEHVPDVRTEGNLTIVPIVEEQLVVQRQLVLVEEVHVRREKDVEQLEIPVALRKQRAEIERTAPDPQLAANELRDKQGPE